MCIQQALVSAAEVSRDTSAAESSLSLSLSLSRLTPYGVRLSMASHGVRLSILGLVPEDSKFS
jgi:hypothetical protein